MEAQMEISAGGRVTSPGRRRAYTIIATFLALAAGVLLWGPVSLVGGWFADGADRIHRVHFLGWGILAGIILTGALLDAISHPERKIAALQQVALALAAVGVAGGISGEPGLLLGIAIISPAVIALYALHPARSEFFKLGEHPSASFGVLTVLAAGVATPFVVHMADLQRNGLATDPHVKDDHWMTMAAMGIAIVFCAALATARTHGWRMPAWCAGLGAGVFGVASIVFGETPGATNVGWAIAAIVWGLAMISVAEWQHHRDLLEEQELFNEAFRAGMLE